MEMEMGKKQHTAVEVIRMTVVYLQGESEQRKKTSWESCSLLLVIVKYEDRAEQLITSNLYQAFITVHWVIK